MEHRKQIWCLTVQNLAFFEKDVLALDNHIYLDRPRKGHIACVPQVMEDGTSIFY